MAGNHAAGALVSLCPAQEADNNGGAAPTQQRPELGTIDRGTGGKVVRLPSKPDAAGG